MAGTELLRTFILEVLDGFANKNLGKDGVAGNVRYDVPTTGHTGGNILTDEEYDESWEKQDRMLAATVLIIADDGKILAVSRRDDPTKWGFPGGKVDDGEEPIDAAARELREETGLEAADLRPVFTMTDTDGYTTTTFVGRVTGKIGTDEEGVIRWVSPSVLTNPDSSPFFNYNRAIFKKLNIKA